MTSLSRGLLTSLLSIIQVFSFLIPATKAQLECSSHCANLGALSYPFSNSSSSLCGDPYLKLDCSGATAKWGHENLTYEVLRVTVGEASESGYMVISPDETMSICGQPPTPANFSYLEACLIRLETEFLEISKDTRYLLFNCSPPEEIPATGNCPDFSQSCPSLGLDPAKCFLTSNRSEIGILAEANKCTSYTAYYNQSLLNETGVLVEWMNLTYADICIGCMQTKGSCGYLDNTESFACYCPSKGPHLFNCSDSDSCTNIFCNKAKGYTLVAIFCLIGFSFIISAVLFIRILQKRRWEVRKKQRSFEVLMSHDCNKEFMHAFAGQVGTTPTKLFTYKELLRATNSFADSRMVGDGGFGSVYEGDLSDGQKVAVKRLYHDSHRRIEQFINEIRILSSLVHPYLIKLYGFCYEEQKELLLVYEYVSNGTLADHLYRFPGSHGEGSFLPWETRLNIAVETAQAIAYLHFSVKPPIYHRDVKSTNILIDQAFHTKVADFGLSRLVPLEVTHISTAPQGTPGYLDPEYHQCYQLTDKSDVYSFGVVLMEIVSAKAPVDVTRERKDINLSHMAVAKVQAGLLRELVDPDIDMDKDPLVAEMLARVADLACCCLATNKDDRPNMKDVAEELQKIRDFGGYEYSHSPSPSPTPSEYGDSVTLMKSKGGKCHNMSPSSVYSKWWSSSMDSRASSTHRSLSLTRSTEF